MTDKPLDCAGTTGPVGKHDFRAAPRPDIVRPGADSCAPVAPVAHGTPGEIWIDDAAGAYTDDPAISKGMTRYVRADLVERGA